MLTADTSDIQFDTEPFRFSHTLSEEPLLSFDALAQAVAENENIAVYHGGIGPQRDGGWHSLYDAPRKMDSVHEAIDHLSDSAAWVRIRLTENPRYSQLITTILEEMSDIAHRDLIKETSIKNMTVFLSSPNAVTPYHFDHETNIYVQLAGKKTLTIYDGRQAEVMTPEAMEGFYISGVTSHRPEVEPFAQPFDLVAGQGLHWPALWPHWVRTGDEVSISMNLNICFKHRDVAARVHQCNYYLRRMGLNPKPIGTSPWSDAVKKLILADPFSSRFITTHDLLRRRVNRIHVPIVMARKLANGVRYLKSHLHVPFLHG